MAGIAKYGWRYEGGELVKDEWEQKVIGRLCGLRGTRNQPGLSFSVIAGMLNAEGKLMRGKFWNQTQVRSVYRQNTEPEEQVETVAPRKEATG